MNYQILFQNGSHFGHLSRHCHPSVKEFVYRKHCNLSIIDLDKTALQIEGCQKFLKQNPQANILVVGTQFATETQCLAKAIKAHCFVGRWKPGSLTNRVSFKENFKVPDIILALKVAEQSILINECKKMGIPIIGICDTNANLKDIDYPIVMNDDNRKSILALSQLLSR